MPCRPEIKGYPDEIGWRNLDKKTPPASPTGFRFSDSLVDLDLGHVDSGGAFGTFFDVK
jgi:hypothetical protein